MDTCELCNGTGLLRVMEELDKHYGYTGQIVAVPPDVPDGIACQMYRYPQWCLAVAECLCLRKRRAISRVEFALSQGRIDKSIAGFSWADFQTPRMKHAHKAVELVRSLVCDGVAMFSNEAKSGLLLVGPRGTGKSSLAYVAMRERAEAGDMGDWVRFPTLIDEIRWTYQPGSTGRTVMEIRAQIQRAAFLVIDEVGSITRAQRADGAQLWAEDAVQTLLFVMDTRHNLHLPTIITSNLSITQLTDQFGEPVVSRMRGLCHVVPMDSSVDLRIAS